MINDNQGERGTNQAYLLWVDGKPSKVSSDRRLLIPHANQALKDGCKTDITWHNHYQECYDLMTSDASFDDYMGDTNQEEPIADVLTDCLDDSFPSYTQYLTVPNSNRFVKSTFALSLLWTAKYFCELEALEEAFSNEAAQCANAALNMFDALSNLFERNSFFEDVLPITADWLCFSC